MNIISAVRLYMKRISNQNYELIWAKTWDDTKRGVDWIKDLPEISPGGWAVGYNYLYVMTRILNEKEPKRVLDLGLGISSTLISQYFKGNNITDGVHDVVEQDAEWVEFYTKKHRISSATSINVTECENKFFNGVKYNAYKDFGNIVKGKKYDVISIDGPKGSEKYSRRDIIEFLPEILNDSFVIVIDDSERKGENNTIKEIENLLKVNGMDYCEGRYPGMSECTVITSEDNRFLCSM